MDWEARQADEYLTADALSMEGYGDLQVLQAIMEQCTDEELCAWIDIASTLASRGELAYDEGWMCS